jgi:hypothetical protein
MYLLANLAPSAGFFLVVISYLKFHRDFIRHHSEEVKCHILFNWLFLWLLATLVVIKPIPLVLCESMLFFC